MKYRFLVVYMLSFWTRTKFYKLHLPHKEQQDALLKMYSVSHFFKVYNKTSKELNINNLKQLIFYLVLQNSQK